MKKILLSFAGIACTLFAGAQLVLNEVYVRPNSGRQQFIELKNTSIAPQSADCYFIVSYFAVNGVRGLYVINIPNITVAGGGYLVGSSQAPSFNYQDTVGTADFSWNDGNINRYLYIGGSLVLDNTGAPYQNVFSISDGSNTNVQNGVYAIFLFNANMLVDAFLGSQNSIDVPNYITQVGALSQVGSDACNTLTYDFLNINNEPDFLFGNVIAAAGSDNGYARMGAGCSNSGLWDKTSAPIGHTPGRANPGNNGNASSGEKLQVTLTCVNATTVAYNITGGSNSAFPVIVSLYHDANGSQFIDAGDVLIGSHTDNSVGDGTYQFTKLATQEDFLFVFDAKGSCYDTIIPLNCPASIVLPVQFTSFTVGRSGSGALLKWETATEINNLGFYVERIQPNGTWEKIGFIPAATATGYSTDKRAYSFQDTKPLRGIVQYRLRQTDRDGRTRFSGIRLLREAGISGAVVFPNPSRGAATILFDVDADTRDIQVLDMHGRTIQQWKGVTDQQLNITHLQPGTYTIRAFSRERSAWSYLKLVVVNK